MAHQHNKAIHCH